MTWFCVRSGEDGDLPAVVSLERSTAEAPHWSEADYAAAVEGGIDYPRRCLFVAEVDAALIGFAVGRIVGHVAELESVAVVSTVRRRGVARALCGAVIVWSRTEGATEMELEVRAASKAAIELYRGLGFVPTGRRPAYYNDPCDDALLMRLDLP